jgi:hypothetical protein
LSQKVNFYTTAGFRGSDEFSRSIRMIDDMIDLQGKIVIGSDWHLGCWYGRGSTKQQILDKKKNMSPIAFAQNYESKWCGSVDNALVDINKLIGLRTLTEAKIKAKENEEFYLGVDVARSIDTSNNQSSVAVIQAIRDKRGRILELCEVNLFNISNALNFTSQAVEIKKIKKVFNARIIILDSNGLGTGLIDELMKESFDPKTKESLGCWNTINTDAQPEVQDAERCLYDLKPQSANSEIIVNFIDMVESGKLRLLMKKQDSDYNLNDRDNYIENKLPFIQTDFLVEEISNLQLKPLPSGKVSINKVISRINRDRVSALMYVLWYIKTFEDNFIEEDGLSDFDFLANYAMF